MANAVCIFYYLDEYDLVIKYFHEMKNLVFMDLPIFTSYLYAVHQKNINEAEVYFNSFCRDYLSRFAYEKKGPYRRIYKIIRAGRKPELTIGPYAVTRLYWP